MVGFAAQRLMEQEVESLTGAAHGERSPERINHRNGYRDRVWETRAGARLPDPLAISVAVVDPLRAALALRGAGQALDLLLHQALRGKPNHLAAANRRPNSSPTAPEGSSSRRSSSGPRFGLN